VRAHVRAACLRLLHHRRQLARRELGAGQPAAQGLDASRGGGVVAQPGAAPDEPARDPSNPGGCQLQEAAPSPEAGARAPVGGGGHAAGRHDLDAVRPPPQLVPRGPPHLRDPPPSATHSLRGALGRLGCWGPTPHPPPPTPHPPPPTPSLGRQAAGPCRRGSRAPLLASASPSQTRLMPRSAAPHAQQSSPRPLKSPWPPVWLSAWPAGGAGPGICGARQHAGTQGALAQQAPGGAATAGPAAAAAAARARRRGPSQQVRSSLAGAPAVAAATSLPA
jgi:hypothetical protein